MTRITELMTSQTVLNNITNDLDQLTNTTNQLSSGLRINQPSDDPYGASLSLQLSATLSSLGQYSNNITDGTSWNTTASSVLSQISNVIGRVRELVVEGSNGTTSQTAQTNIAAEVDQLIDEVKSQANSQYAGSYIFSGTASLTPPYQAGANDAYQGNAGTISRQIGPNSTVQVNVGLSGLLGNGQASGDGLLLDTLRTISSDLKSGNTGSLGSTDLQNIDSNLSTLQQMEAQLGAVNNRLTLASSRITAISANDTKALAADQDVDIASATTKYATQQAAYQAALKTGAGIVQSSLLDFLGTV
jgi:flagellar hook-associated protein 3 FlgL